MFSIGLLVAALCKTTKSMNVATFLLYFPMLLFSEDLRCSAQIYWRKRIWDRREYQGILHRWYLEQGQRERVAIRDPDSCEENQKVRMMSGSYSWTLFEAMRGRKFAHRVRIHGSRFLPWIGHRINVFHSMNMSFYIAAFASCKGSYCLCEREIV